MKRTAPGFSLVDFGNQIPVGTRRRRAQPPGRRPAHHAALRLPGPPRRRRPAPHLPGRRGDRRRPGRRGVPDDARVGREGHRRTAGAAQGVSRPGARRAGRRSPVAGRRSPGAGSEGGRPPSPTCLPVGMLGRPCVTASRTGRTRVPHRPAYLPPVRGHLRPGPHRRRRHGQPAPAATANDVFSKGFVCPKGASLPRGGLRPRPAAHPLVRVDGELREAGPGRRPSTPSPRDCAESSNGTGPHAVGVVLGKPQRPHHGRRPLPAAPRRRPRHPQPVHRLRRSPRRADPRAVLRGRRQGCPPR
ncbi:hypothetical protein STENM223S_09813 [Streptomyces tendae]